MFERNGAVQLLVDCATAEIVDANPAAEQFYGMSHAELTSTPMLQINGMLPEELRELGETIRRGGRIHYTRKHRLGCGELRDVEVFTGPVTIHGRMLLHSIVHDVSDRIRAEQAMQESEARYRLLFASNPRPSWVYDLESMRFLAVNPAAVAQYGYTEPEFLTMTLADIRPTDALDEVRSLVDRAGSGLIAPTQSRHLTRNGREIEVEIASRPLEYDGRRARLVVVEDVTDRRRLEAALTNLAVRDELTGLLNRRGFQQMAEHEIKVANRAHRHDAVLYVDLDGF
jgi:PAS domain S-box-containing protein